MKKCIRCNAEKPLTDYYAHPKAKDGKQGVCKTCSHAYQVNRRKETWPKLFEYAGGKCAHCGISDVTRPEIYDFHHTDPTQKEKQIASLIRGSWEKLIKEVDKCLLLCANCHRTEHARLRHEEAS